MASRVSLQRLREMAINDGDQGRVAKLTHRLNQLEKASPQEQAISFIMDTDPITPRQFQGEGGDVPLGFSGVPVLGGVLKGIKNLPEMLKRQSGTGFERQIDRNIRNTPDTIPNNLLPQSGTGRDELAIQELVEEQVKDRIQKDSIKTNVGGNDFSPFVSGHGRPLNRDPTKTFINPDSSPETALNSLLGTSSPVKDAVDKVLNEMDGIQRQVIELSLQGMQPRQIVESTGLTANQVKRALQRGRPKMKDATKGLLGSFDQKLPRKRPKGITESQWAQAKRRNELSKKLKF